MFFSKEEKNRKIHLRQLLQAAVIIEEKGKIFYENLAEKATRQEVKDLCKRLAKDEIRHKQLIEEILSHWLPLPADKESLVSIDKELKGRGIFLDPPSPDSTEEDMARYAIQQEEKMAQFYLLFEKEFPELWKKTNIQILVAEERSHANQLISSYPHLS